MLTLQGGCQCGRHRYIVRMEKPEGYFCHCRMCQRAFGNIFATFINVPVAEVRWETGEPAWYRSSPIARRGYCAGCGTPLAFHYLDGERMDLAVGSLDEPERVHPTEHTGVESRLEGWIHTRPLPESRMDENPGVQTRWQAAGLNQRIV